MHVAPAQSVAAVRWADSVTKTLSTHEALAQLLLVVPPANGIAQDVANYSPGGVYAAAGSLLLQQQAPLPLWQAMPFGQLLATESAFLCANEQLLFSATDTIFLQKMGQQRALDYLQSGISLVEIGKPPCIQHALQKQAFTHYLQGLCNKNLRCVSALTTSADGLDVTDSLPLLRTHEPAHALRILHSRLRKDLRKADVFAACRRLLQQKYTHLVAPHLLPVPSSPLARKWACLQQALTLLRHKSHVLPLQGLDTLRIASLAFTKTEARPFFADRLLDYLEMQQYLATPQRTPQHLHVQDNDYLIVSIHAGDAANGFSDAQLKYIEALHQRRRVIWVYFGAAAGLRAFPQLAHAHTLLFVQENSQAAQDLAVQALFGGIGIQGRLSVSMPPFHAGEGVRVQPNGSLSFVPAALLGINTRKLHSRIHDILNEAFDNKAFPGCQLLIAKDGRVFFYEGYGYHTYAQQVPVRNTSLYDLASLTKVMAPTTALMQLYDANIFRIDAQLFDYLPKWKHHEKGTLRFRKLLTHHAGLQSWIPYYKLAFKANGKRKRRYLSTRHSRRYSTYLNDTLYLRKTFKRKIYKEIKKSPMGTQGYKYSGLVFYLLPDIIARLSNEAYATYLNTHFYAPLGAQTITFLPKERFSLSRIVPTEVDNNFRMQLLHGVVHDEGAIMMGGISGNAGLFAKTIDVAKLWQMYLQGGYYGGNRYLTQEVLHAFTTCQFCEEGNRRGLGFDKPPIVYKAGKSSVAPQASHQSFGHTGFTGTISWADPVHGLLFIFLSNRVHPTRANNALAVRDIRPRLQKAIYESLCIAEGR